MNNLITLCRRCHRYVQKHTPGALCSPEARVFAARLYEMDPELAQVFSHF
jgi:hypothetical protein